MDWYSRAVAEKVHIIEVHLSQNGKINKKEEESQGVDSSSDFAVFFWGAE